jgi:N-acetylglucosamine kinase-like BadF-type ATPase
LGYILGDEGSGAHMGLTLCKKYLNNELPEDIKSLLEDSYPISRDIILDNVYRKPFPNRFLAHYSYFIKESIDHPYIRFMIREIFLEFIDKHIKVFTNFPDYKIRCVGSIAFHFQDILEECSIASEIEFDKIIQSPIDSLVQIYSKNDH